MLNGLATLIRLLLFPVGRTMQPLDPAPLLQPHYRPSSLLRAGPPQVSASVLSPHGFHHLNFSLGIRALVPVVPHKSLDRVHAPYTPVCRTPSSQAPGALIPETPFAPGFDSTLIRRVNEGFVFAVSPNHTCPETLLRTLTSTLTTSPSTEAAWSWFEACSWKPASKGLPSSLTQLVHAQVRFSLTKTSFFVLYGTQRGF